MKALIVCSLLITGGISSLNAAAAGSTRALDTSIERHASPSPPTELPRDLMVWQDVDPVTVTKSVSSNVIFLNNCQPSGCVVRSGLPNSQADTWGINGQHTLTPFDDSDATWAEVVACVSDVFAPFGVSITTVDPGTAPHFEIMIAGAPGDLGISSGFGGVSPFNCALIENSLVFDFSKVWQGNVEQICSAAAQEISHSFGLDHVIDPSDPMTYVPYAQRRYFQDAAIPCGSDCVDGRGPLGQTCTGPGISGVAAGPQVRACCGTASQNSVAHLLSIFGSSTPTPPIVTITQPLNGQAVQPGFSVTAQVTDNTGVTKVELRIDGELVQTLTATPYDFSAPPVALADGAHSVEVTGYDVSGTSGTASVNAIIGQPCNAPSDCPIDTDTGVGGCSSAGLDARQSLGIGFCLFLLFLRPARRRETARVSRGRSSA